MTFNEFIKKKYWNRYFDLKVATRDFKENQKRKQKYFMLKWKKDKTYELMILKGQIIW